MGEYVAGFGVSPDCKKAREWAMFIKPSLPADAVALKTLLAERNVQSFKSSPVSCLFGEGERETTYGIWPEPVFRRRGARISRLSTDKWIEKG
jgi:hypothetical protein